MDPALLAALQQWAEDDFRSLNGQIEYLLKQAILKRGKKLPDEVTPASDADISDDNGQSTP